MSALTAKKTTEWTKWRKIILPLYVIISALFILYVWYSYFQWVVYRSWAISWQQQWYTTAVIELINRVGEKCEPVAISAWETQVDVINVACLQQQASAETSFTWSESAQ